MMHESSPHLRIGDLASVLQALMPERDVSPFAMLMVLAELRRTGRLVTLDTTPAAFRGLASALDMTTAELNHAFRQAPDMGRARLKRALLRPEHHGCLHLRSQLKSSTHTGALLDAFVTASWYGWPGLRWEIRDPAAGHCCCGIAASRSPHELAVAKRHSMGAIDI